MKFNSYYLKYLYFNWLFKFYFVAYNQYTLWCQKDFKFEFLTSRCIKYNLWFIILILLVFLFILFILKTSLSIILQVKLMMSIWTKELNSNWNTLKRWIEDNQTRILSSFWEAPSIFKTNLMTRRHQILWLPTPTSML